MRDAFVFTLGLACGACWKIAEQESTATGRLEKIRELEARAAKLEEALRQASDMCARPSGVCFYAALLVSAGRDEQEGAVK